MRKYNVAVLGVSGAVGRMMLRVLEEREFPIGTFKLLASSRSAGKGLPCWTQEFLVFKFRLRLDTETGLPLQVGDLGLQWGRRRRWGLVRTEVTQRGFS